MGRDMAHTGNDSVAAGDRAEPPCPLPAQPEREPFIGHMPVEPTFAAVYAILLFGEKPTVTELFGMAAVVLGVYLVKRQYDGD